MKRNVLLLMAFLLTAPAIPAAPGIPTSSELLSGLDTALACCSGTDRQRCSALCGGRTFCDQGACLCACPV
jgi:hypothetical protein